jgi:osmotically-inducible protein OsmY
MSRTPASTNTAPTALRAPVRTVSSRLMLAGVLAAAVLQAGCAAVAVTGISMGALSIADRRTVGTQAEDQGIEFKAMQHLSKLDPMANVSATSFNRKLLLTGQVPDDKTRREAAAIASRIEQVRNVHNELAIGFTATVATRAKDSSITAQVKARLFDAKDLQANTIKVITESGVVYLMGIVTRAEGEHAAKLASLVSGVRRVVTVFEYVSPDELARIERAARESSQK